MGYLDDRDPGLVEPADDRSHLFLGELVRQRVGSVTECRVGQPKGGSHVCTMWRWVATASPTLVAAAVMMSRFPAYGGK